MSTVLITGGAGFIGSNLVRSIAHAGQHRVVVFDALTYAGNLENLAGCIDGSAVSFVHGNILDADLVHRTMELHRIDAVIHLAAESHVDRSIASAAPFVETNVAGTLIMLEAMRTFGVSRFVHVSTDEVYGSLEPTDAPFTERSPINPTSPYAASKAASDLLVLSFVRTHGVDAVITRCSNNYGPYQFPEKFIPLMTLNALEKRPLPVYGDGKQIRDWIHVDDHCSGLLFALEKGRSGEVYNFGGAAERKNLAVVNEIVQLTGADPALITHGTDRKAHDRRYAIDATKAHNELGWTPMWSFEEGLKYTVEWYKAHPEWCGHVRSGEYRSYYEQHYKTSL
ncbi:MAG: dTDP-glucose 4,6-dehydratase [Candidatus Kapabacteria bacterium]|nr:dTDP-glucose 4,6-dehydratase [Candidatus Kapabacteria bacterium]